MNIAISIACVVGAIAAILPVAKTSESFSALAVQSASILGWIGVLGGATGIYFGELSGLDSLLAIAGCAMLAVLPANLPSESTRRFTSPWVAAPALALGIASLLGLTAAETGSSAPGQAELLLLYAAVFGGLAATASSLISSTSLADLSVGEGEQIWPGIGAALIVLTAVVAVWLLGAARSTGDAWTWAVPLAIDGQPHVWRIPDGANLPRGLSFDASAKVQFAIPLLVATVGAALAAAWHAVTGGKQKYSFFLWMLPAAFSGALLVLLWPGTVSVGSVEPGVYADLARDWLVNRGLSEELAEFGGFAREGKAVVNATALLPEYILLGAVFVTSLVATGLSFAPASTEPEQTRDALAVGMLSRDLTVRAVIIGWLAWLMTVLVHWSHFGYYGVGSPSEITLVGALTLASGIGLLGWSLPRREPWGRLRALSSGLMLVVLVLAIVVSLVFNTPVGLSLSL
ncbi:MAG: hypothetical protein ACQEVA_15530 [Myxococcota bacterium]